MTGADDIFVFDAAWRLAALAHPRENFASDTAYDVARMQEALPHAALTMFATSLTTAVAFFANAVSLVPPIRLFGLFAGLMVVVLYAMVVLWLPSIIALQVGPTSHLSSRISHLSPLTAHPHPHSHPHPHLTLAMFIFWLPSRIASAVATLP